MPVLVAGDTVTLQNTFLLNGTATDTTVTLTVTDPTGTATVYSGAQITRSGPGVYYRDVPAATAGTWTYTWIGTGTVADIEAGTFDVQPNDAGRLYATPAQLKSRLSLPDSDTSSDLELAQACRTASRMVERVCGRVFWRGPAGEARTVVLPAGRGVCVDFGPYNDAVAVTALAWDLDGDGTYETPWAGTWALVGGATAPEPQPYTGLTSSSYSFAGWSWGYGRVGGRLQVTGTWGWPAVPAAVAEAARILSAEVFRTKDAPLGLASFGDAGVARVRRNPLVEDLLAPYRHPSTIGVLA